MGQHAHLRHGYIELDTGAWITQRVTGPHEHLNEQLAHFSRTLARIVGPTILPLTTLNAVEAFIAARAEHDPGAGAPRKRSARAARARIDLVEAQQALSLNQAIIVHRYRDPEAADAVIVTNVHGPYVSGTPTIYTGAGHGPEVWTTLQADITCAIGHRFRHGPGPLTFDAVLHPPTGDLERGRLTFTTEHPPRLLCPQCGNACDVELADVQPPAPS